MSPADLGADLERLPGVLAATVFSDYDRAPLVYLATAPGADRDTLRDAVLQLLSDRGHPAHPDRVHLAAPPHRGPSGAPLPPFSLDRLDVHRTEGRAECAVEVRTPERSYTGVAREPDTPAGRARAGARAILVAIETLDPDLRLGLHGARRLNLFGEEAVAVLVEATAGRAHAHLPGLALVDRSVEETAALAAIRALRGWGTG